MPANTNVRLQNEVIYSVFVRNHTQEGTFRALIGDLPRIHALGCDIVWLLPIHPLGEKNRKGSLGSPYANRDYRGINPEYGTMEDFRALVDAIHTEGMRCMIDVVYHHTSPDSVLWEAHPEWFYRKPDGRPGNHVGDWSDVIDLDFDQPALWDYLIETLVGWARVVDGFRCDVASLVPVGFWERARRAVAEVNPDCVWLAETVHRSFGAEMRRRGLTYMSDAEGYRAFDIEYSYDIWETFERWLAGAAPLSHLLDLLDFQDSAYPTGFNKLRYLENHDQPRIASRVTDDAALRVLTALIYFLKGTTLVYAGQEVGCDHVPTLFDRDPVDWTVRHDLAPLMRQLSAFKHERLGTDDLLRYVADDEHDIAFVYREPSPAASSDATPSSDTPSGTAPAGPSSDDAAPSRYLGVFPLRGRGAEVSVDLPDGAYRDFLTDTDVPVANGRLTCGSAPLILAY